jgi:hypothetical protein
VGCNGIHESAFERREVNPRRSTMKTKMSLFGVALVTMVTSGAMFFSQQSLARPSDELRVPLEEEEALFQRPPHLDLADLAGSWAISVGGNTGCGLTSLYVTVDLDAAGSGMARILRSSTGCPPGDDPAQPFQILSLNADGSGTAGLSCGPACGWTFTIQVPRGSTNLFTVVDVAPENPGNVLVGTAARKW